MKDFFKPEDFMINQWSRERAEVCALVAQAKLNKEIEKWPVVYGGMPEFHDWTKRPTDYSTHTARLAFISEIKPKECEHSPLVANDPGRFGLFISLSAPVECSKCGKKLKATWSAVDEDIIPVESKEPVDA